LGIVVCESDHFASSQQRQNKSAILAVVANGFEKYRKRIQKLTETEGKKNRDCALQNPSQKKITPPPPQKKKKKEKKRKEKEKKNECERNIPYSIPTGGRGIPSCCFPSFISKLRIYNSSLHVDDIYTDSNLL
jgi:hypothetical protein